MSNTILIVDDEVAIRDMMCTTLELAGYHCLEAHNVTEALNIIVNQRPSLILLDWMLPNNTSGIDLCRRLKNDENLADIPVIMLTACANEDNKVMGLDAGADDYITKPFSTRELLSRLKAVLRRANTLSEDTAIQIKDLVLDPKSQRVTVKDITIDISPTEYRLLAFFMIHADRAYTRAQLLDHVWGGNVYLEDRTVDVHIRRLRKVLEPFGYESFIQTVRGTGYRFSAQNI